MHNIEAIFESFNRLNVLIIGDVMIDSYIWGKVERISPEAPVPILNVTRREKRLGGAANVALNIQALGANPILCGLIGNDTDGNDFLQLLSEQKLSNDAIVKSNSRLTTIKHRVMSGSHHIIRIDQENEHTTTQTENDSLIEKILELLPQSDVVVFEDYDKGVLGKELIQRIVSEANFLNIPSVVDPKKKNFLHYKNVTLFKPNKKELKEGLKLESSLNSLEDLEHTVEQLQNELAAQNILITLSEQGVFAKSKTYNFHFKAHVRTIADVSGAGDTVISTAALCVALKLPLDFIAQLSNLSGGLVCEQVGVVPIDKNKLLAEAKKLNFMP